MTFLSDDAQLKPKVFFFKPSPSDLSKHYCVGCSRIPHRDPPRQGSQPRHRSTSASHGCRSPSRPRSPARVILRTDKEHSLAAATAVKPYASRRPPHVQPSNRTASHNGPIAPGPSVPSKAPGGRDGYNQQLGSWADERSAGPDSRKKQREGPYLHKDDPAPRRGGPERGPPPERWPEGRDSLHAERDVPPHGRGMDRRMDGPHPGPERRPPPERWPEGRESLHADREQGRGMDRWMDGPHPGRALQPHQPDDMPATSLHPARDWYSSRQPWPEALPGRSWEGPPPHSGRGRPPGLHTSAQHAEERRQAPPQRPGWTHARGRVMSPQPRGELPHRSIPHRSQERQITPRRSPGTCAPVPDWPGPACLVLEESMHSMTICSHNTGLDCG